MIRSDMQNGQTANGVARQQFLLDVVDEHGVGRELHAKPKKPRAQKRPASRESSGVESQEVVEIVTEVLVNYHARLSAIELLLREIHDKAIKGPVKEYYTTQEVARILSKRPYTVREWCRLGRVHGEKAYSGRGLDEEWRISHTELVRIQNEGLLHQTRGNQVPMPGRLAKRGPKAEQE